MGRKVEKHRANGRWSEARYFAFIRSALRRASSKWPVKFDVKNEARRKKPLHTHGRHRFEYQCKACDKWFPDKEVTVDHIKPAGVLKSYSDLPSFVEILFCEKDNLQVLCEECHKTKTAKERKDRNEQKRAD
jgi:5-methylcytosine-specific restriction endonuclease McrA